MSKTSKTIRRPVNGVRADRRDRQHVYIVTNPAWPDWVKIGVTNCSQARLLAYNTATPFKDFAIHSVTACQNATKTERRALTLLSIAHERRGEWARCSLQEARKAILDSRC